MFTIAVATVFFPRLSALKASENAAEHKREYAKGFLMTLAVAVPATFGLIAFAPDILAVLFQWGVFNALRRGNLHARRNLRRWRGCRFFR